MTGPDPTIQPAGDGPASHPIGRPGDPGLASRLHADLVEQVVAGGGAADRLEWERAALVSARDALPLATDAQVHDLASRIVDRAVGLGPLEDYLADESVSDVLVNGDGSVWVERGGRLVATGLRLERDVVEHLIDRIVAPLGRRVDRSAPAVDARLADGSRVHAIIPPLAVDGPSLTIRRFPPRPVALGAMARGATVDLLRWVVAAGWNLVVCGGTGSGKTTLLNALVAHVPPSARIVTIEDAAELRLPVPHVVRLETRPGGPGDVLGVALRELVRHALRMRPDRIVVGEVRGPEALDMVQAMLTGHDGCLTTCHAPDAASALRRLHTLCLMAEVALPAEAVAVQLGAAIDAVVTVTRTGSRHRTVSEVVEVVPNESGWSLRPLVADGAVVAAPSLPARDPLAPTPPLATEPAPPESTPWR